MPAKYVTEDGIQLGRWISNIKTKYNAGQEPITAEQFDKLKALGFSLETKFSAMWNHKYELAKKYYEEH